MVPEALLTLMKALNTTKLDTIIPYLAIAPIDVDVLLYEAQEFGYVEIDLKKRKIKALREPDTLYSNTELLVQMRKLIAYYDKQEANITKTRLEIVVLDPSGSNGYPLHDFICSLYVLEQQEDIKTYSISVPKTKEHPAHTFQFYTFLDHEKFGQEAVSDFKKQFEKKKKKK